MQTRWLFRRFLEDGQHGSRNYLEPGEDDTQDVHTSDELYYVIEGNGFIELGRKTRKQINEGSIIFVPAGLHHKFYGNSRKLVVLYVFARKE